MNAPVCALNCTPNWIPTSSSGSSIDRSRAIRLRAAGVTAAVASSKVLSASATKEERNGELLGLTWGMVNLDAGELYVGELNFAPSLPPKMIFSSDLGSPPNDLSACTVSNHPPLSRQRKLPAMGLCRQRVGLF